MFKNCSLKTASTANFNFESNLLEKTRKIVLKTAQNLTKFYLKNDTKEASVKVIIIVHCTKLKCFFLFCWWLLDKQTDRKTEKLQKIRIF